MSEIWNLSALCRCCHSDGQFKSLKRTYVVKNEVEIYSSMLRDTFGIIIEPPAASSDISYTICDRCIEDLRRATNFKKQVLICESKFEEYCKNEESFKFIDDIKMEIQSTSDNSEREDFNGTSYDDADEDKKLSIEALEVKNEYKVDVKDGITNVKREECAENKPIQVSTDVKKIKTKNENPKKTKKSRTNSSRYQLDDSHLQLIVKTGNSYTCKKCGVKFKNISNLKIHIQHKHIGIPYKCRLCQTEFKILSDLRKHMVIHNPNPNICTYCGKVYPTKYTFDRHVNSHTKNYTFECDYCQKKFMYKKSLLIHIKLLHLKLPKPLICDVCGHSFNDSTNLKKHVQAVHEKLRPFKCELCTKDFTAKKHLVVHVRRDHTGERPYVCDICPEAFVCSQELIRHKSKIHEGKIVNFTCKLCLMTFERRGQLVKHSKSHSGSKPLICDVCNRDFSCKYSLRRHVSGHSGEKRFQCTICMKKFIQKAGLHRHIERLHTEKATVEKKKCHICGKHVVDIQKHIDAHNNKPYGCDYCPKRYPERNALNRHIANIHFGRKAHACDLCDHKYVHPRSLRNHKLKVHKIASKIEKDEGLDEYMTTYVIKNNKAGTSNVDVKIDVSN